MKICKNCQIEKPETEFSPLKSGRGGLNPWCKPCRRNQSKAIRVANPDISRAQDRIRYADNPDGKKASIARWYAKNREKRLADMARRYQEKREQVIAQKAEYRALNRDKISVLNGMRRAAERRATPVWADRKAMAEMYREARRLSKETEIPHHVDHIYPLKHRHFCGLHVETNMQILTAIENMKKGNQWPE